MNESELESSLLSTALTMLETALRIVDAADPSGAAAAARAAAQLGLNTTLCVGKTLDGRAGLWLGLTDPTTGARVIELLRLDAVEPAGRAIQ